jgi:hypothetical protein
MKGVLKGLIRSREGAASACVVLIYGLMLGYFVWYTYFGHVEQTYPVSWQASWIGYPDEEVMLSYFRKKIYLTQNVRHAWIKVMAPDSFVVYVNGTQIGSGTLTSDNATNFFDLTTQLKTGTNVIAISASRSNYPGASKIAVEGIYEDWQGIEHKISSDKTWKANRFGEWLLSGQPEWYNSEFNDTHWKYAQVKGVPASKDNSKVAFDPSIYTEKVRGYWIRSPSLTSQNLYLRYPLNIPTKPKDAWLRIASREDQDYYVTINDTLVAEKQRSIAPVAEFTPLEPTLEMYNVAPFLRKGSNVVALRVTGWPSKIEVVADGLVRDDKGTALWVSTPTGWKVAAQESEGWTSARFDDSQWVPAQARSSTTAQDRFTKSIVVPTPSDGYQLNLFMKIALCLFITALSVLLFWLLLGIVVSKIKKIELLKALYLSSLAYAVPLLFLVFLLELACDVRFDQAFPFQRRFVLVGLLLLAPCALLLLLTKAKRRRYGQLRQIVRFRYGGALLLVGVLSLALRLQDLGLEVLNGDEVTMGFFSQGVLNRGYPVMHLSPGLPERIVSTSEVIPYSMALSSVIFGGMSPEFQLRFSGAFFGTLTTLLLYFFSSWWFDKRVGLLAAMLYAVLPMAINMAQYARYPAQLEFFALLTVYLFCRYISAEGRKEGVKFAYLSVPSFAMTYLSWEGSAFLLPAMFFGLMLFKGRDWSWVQDKHLWICGVLVSTVIFFQLGLRYVQSTNALVVGSGISDLNLAAQWLQPGYDPIAFLNNFLLVEKSQVITLFSLIGLVLCFRDKPLLFINGATFPALILWTNLVETQDYRHFYYFLPLVILSACRAFFQVSDFLFERSKRLLSRTYAPAMVAVAKVGLIAILFFSTNDHVLRLYNLPNTSAEPGLVRLDTRNDSGLKKAFEALKRDIEPGDKFVALRPHQLLFYSANNAYFAETILQLPVVIPNDDTFPVHRAEGSRWVYNTDTLKEMLNEKRRLWIILESEGTFYDAEFTAYLKSQTLLKYEDPDTRVYFWRR